MFIFEETLERFQAFGLEPSFCPEDLGLAHLSGFATSFIHKSHIKRWVWMLTIKPQKAPKALGTFERQLDKVYCKPIRGSQFCPAGLTERFGSAKGVYFDGSSAPCLLTIAEAWPIGQDAIFSILPGKRAVFFHHEEMGWICERG